MGRTVVVTGANGFIGRHLCAELVGNGWAVRGVVRRLEVTEGLTSGIEPYVHGDRQPLDERVYIPFEGQRGLM